jgi:hypothetical protein
MCEGSSMAAPPATRVVAVGGVLGFHCLPHLID